MVPILNKFERHYQTLSLALIRRQVQYRMVEDTVQSILQAFANMGAPYYRLTSQGEIEIHLRFQYQSYNNQDPPPN